MGKTLADAPQTSQQKFRTVQMVCSENARLRLRFRLRVSLNLSLNLNLWAGSIFMLDG